MKRRKSSVSGYFFQALTLYREEFAAVVPCVHMEESTVEALQSQEPEATDLSAFGSFDDCSGAPNIAQVAV